MHNVSRKGTNELSFNNCQWTSPNLYPDLQSQLVSWKRHAVAIICDISEIFCRIGIVNSREICTGFFYQSHNGDILTVCKCLVILFGEKTLSIYYFKVSKHHGSRPKVQIESPTAAEVVLIYG